MLVRTHAYRYFAISGSSNRDESMPCIGTVDIIVASLSGPRESTMSATPKTCPVPFFASATVSRLRVCWALISHVFTPDRIRSNGSPLIIKATLGRNSFGEDTNDRWRGRAAWVPPTVTELILIRIVLADCAAKSACRGDSIWGAHVDWL